jgi:hypothetical protein
MWVVLVDHLDHFDHFDHFDHLIFAQKTNKHTN